jgi:hypothetical protein
VEQKFALSAEPSSKLESFSRSYLLMFLWSLSVSRGVEMLVLEDCFEGST